MGASGEALPINLGLGWSLCTGGRMGGCVAVAVAVAAVVLAEVPKEEKGEEVVESGGCGWAGECFVGLRPEEGGAFWEVYCCGGGVWAKVFRDGVAVGCVVVVDEKEWEGRDADWGIA